MLQLFSGKHTREVKRNTEICIFPQPLKPYLDIAPVQDTSSRKSFSQAINPQDSRSNQVTAIRSILAVVIGFTSLSALSQTAEELVAKNLQAKGGVDKIKAIKSDRMSGNFDAVGFKA